MTVHLLGLPHTDPIRDTWDHCAFTGKIRRLADMLTSTGHGVTLYAGERHDTTAQLVTVATDEDRRRWFGDETWAERVFDRWDPDDACWVEMNDACIAALRERLQPGDVIASPIGNVQAKVAAAFPEHRTVETGVGYHGTFAPFRVYESYAWMHHCYGAERIDGRFFDTVIPNAYDPAEFTTMPKRDYVLYLGRMIERKGRQVVAELAQRFEVLTAGQGEPIPGATHLGVVHGKQKAELLAEARCVVVPTLYVEPFGGVAVEAQMSGTPAITTDWGAFTETVVDGVTGYRCRTLGEFTAAIERAPELDSDDIRRRATLRYSTDTVAQQYDAYLQRLALLDGDGWYA